MTKKLALKNLKLKSFVTTKDGMKEIQGGRTTPVCTDANTWICC